MSKHTPGPWMIEEDERARAFRVMTEEWARLEDGQEYREVVASVTEPDNARLIAAAPDLLEAVDDVIGTLEYLINLWGDEAITRRLVDKLLAVSAKAKGGDA